MIFSEVCQKRDLGLNFLPIKTYSLSPKEFPLCYLAKWFTNQRLKKEFYFMFHLNVSKFHLKHPVLSKFYKSATTPSHPRHPNREKTKGSSHPVTQQVSHPPALYDKNYTISIFLSRFHYFLAIGESCKEIRENQPSYPSGNYAINATRIGEEYITVYCDMVMDEGIFNIVFSLPCP